MDRPDRPCCMLRLRRKADIERTFEEGARCYSASVVLHARRREVQEGVGTLPRLSVIAGKRFRTAVARNRARRVLREACRAALGDGEGYWDLVLLARPGVLSLPAGARLEAVAGLLRRAGVLSGEGVAAP